MLWLVALAVSVGAWFVGDWLAAIIWPHDDTAQFLFSFMFSVVLGAAVMLIVRMRAVGSGSYKKAGWGVRRR
jgi:hypothetical protein